MAAAAARTLSGLPSAQGAAEGRWGRPLSLPSLGCWDRGRWGGAGVHGLTAPGCCMEHCLGLFREPRASPSVVPGWPTISRKAGRTSNPHPLLGGIQAHLSHLSGWEAEWAPWPPPSPSPTSTTVPC